MKMAFVHVHLVLIVAPKYHQASALWLWVELCFQLVSTLVYTFLRVSWVNRLHSFPFVCFYNCAQGVFLWKLMGSSMPYLCLSSGLLSLSILLDTALLVKSQPLFRMGAISSVSGVQTKCFTAVPDGILVATKPSTALSPVSNTR